MWIHQSTNSERWRCSRMGGKGTTMRMQKGSRDGERCCATNEQEPKRERRHSPPPSPPMLSKWAPGMPQLPQQICCYLEIVAIRFFVDITRVFRIYITTGSKLCTQSYSICEVAGKRHCEGNITWFDCFKPAYGPAICMWIIDCFEIFIQCTTSLTARAQTYLNYKSHKQYCEVSYCYQCYRWYNF